MANIADVVPFQHQAMAIISSSTTTRDNNQAEGGSRRDEDIKSDLVAAQGLGRRGKGVSAEVEETNTRTDDSCSHEIAIVGHEDEHQKEPDKDLRHVKKRSRELLLVR